MTDTSTPATHWIVPRPVWDGDNYILEANFLLGWITDTDGEWFAATCDCKNSTVLEAKTEARAWVEAETMKQLGAVEYVPPVDQSTRIAKLEAALKPLAIQLDLAISQNALVPIQASLIRAAHAALKGDGE